MKKYSYSTELKQQIYKQIKHLMELISIQKKLENREIYFVDPLQGIDSYDGLKPHSAFCTKNRALNECMHGDLIVIYKYKDNHWDGYDIIEANIRIEVHG